MKNLLIATALIATTTVAAQHHPLDAAVDSLRTEKDLAVLNTRLQQLGSGTERDLDILINYYIYNKTKKDSIERIAISRFPNSDLVFKLSNKNLFNEEDPVKREKLFTALAAKFPNHNLDQARFTVANGYAKAGNIAKVQEYVNATKAGETRLFSIGSIVQELMNHDPATAAALLKPEMERIMNQAATDPKIESRYNGYFALYGHVLLKSGNYKEANSILNKAYENSNRKDADLSADYALVLNKNGEHTQALPILEKLVNEGNGGAVIRKAFEESYAHENPGKSAKEYLAAVDRRLKEKTEAEVAKMLINEPSPDFILKDASGNTVSLATFKGKTIVVDFWATWCGPCKKSFPAMQRVVNQYKKDPNVKFLFVHTLEKVADPLTDAKNYLNTNHYTFDLYLDEKNPETKKNPAVKAFNVTGIPTKFIIDKTGNIRFKKLGFSGSDDVAVSELTAMIEIAANHPSPKPATAAGTTRQNAIGGK